MSALDPRITYPSNMHREAQLLFRMTQPLKVILLCVKNTLQLMDELPAETERFLLTVPTVDQLHLDPTPECSICFQGLDRTEGSHADTSGVRSHDLLVRLPCKHIICYGCLKTWLAKAGSCPICRHELTSRIFIEEDTDPRTEVNSRPILESILSTGLAWLAAVTTEDDTDENTFGRYCMWASYEETAEQRAAMDALKFFTVFSTSVEDETFQGEFRQRWIAEFHRKNNTLVAIMTPINISAGRERQLHRMEEEGDGDREEPDETNSEDERRYREMEEAEEEEKRKQDEYEASQTRARSSRISEYEEDWERHYSCGWWGTDDEAEELMAAEGEKLEQDATDDSRGFAEMDLRSDEEALGYSLLDLSSSPLTNYNEQDQNDSF